MSQVFGHSNKYHMRLTRENTSKVFCGTKDFGHTGHQYINRCAVSFLARGMESRVLCVVSICFTIELHVKGPCIAGAGEPQSRVSVLSLTDRHFHVRTQCCNWKVKSTDIRSIGKKGRRKPLGSLDVLYWGMKGMKGPKRDCKREQDELGSSVSAPSLPLPGMLFPQIPRPTPIPLW